MSAIMKILIVDSVETINYDFKYMETNSLGGTESTVLRVARELAKQHEVYLSQLNRETRNVESGITYLPCAEDAALNPAPDVVLIVRKYKMLPVYRQRYPNARLFVWVHNYQPYEILGRRHLIIKNRGTVICVSRRHRDYIDHVLNGGWSWIFRTLAFRFARVPVTYIYNLIDPDFKPDAMPYRKDKLFFFSTANKGLDQVLINFKALLKVAPEFKLYIANNTKEQLQEYKLDHELLQSDAVVLVGKVPKSEVIRHLRNSLCVFYPQNRHAETFGLVYAEANCVGTPVIAHPFGSAEEVIENKEQLVDAEDSDAIIQKVLAWRDQGRPHVACPEHLQLPVIMQNWSDTLGLK